MKKLSEKKKMDHFRLLLYLHENPNCEVCGGKVIDPPHHVIFRSQGGGKEDDNLITLCRLDHNRAHFLAKPYLHKYDLWECKGLDIEKMREKYLLARSGGKKDD